MIVGGQVLVGAGLSVAGDRAVDDAGIDRGDVRVAKAQARHGSRRQVLDHHVRLLRQLKKHPSALRMLEVQGDALDPFRALEETKAKVVVGLPIGAYSFWSGIGADTADRIAATGHLHFDDLGPESRKRHAEKWSGEENRD